MKLSLFSPIIALLLFSAQMLHSQIFDDFSDKNLDQNPSWVGDTAIFKISNAGELQLNADGSGPISDFCSRQYARQHSLGFWCAAESAPSNQNLVRIYLQIDQTDLAAANGYYLEMGETGALDAIRFFKQDGATKLLLACDWAAWTCRHFPQSPYPRKTYSIRWLDGGSRHRRCCITTTVLIARGYLAWWNESLFWVSVRLHHVKCDQVLLRQHQHPSWLAWTHRHPFWYWQ